jgi:hypothetical protein
LVGLTAVPSAELAFKSAESMIGKHLEYSSLQIIYKLGERAT